MYRYYAYTYTCTTHRCVYVFVCRCAELFANTQEPVKQLFTCFHSPVEMKFQM